MEVSPKNKKEKSKVCTYLKRYYYSVLSINRVCHANYPILRHHFISQSAVTYRHRLTSHLLYECFFRKDFGYMMIISI